jgi:hypothetical protein
VLRWPGPGRGAAPRASLVAVLAALVASGGLRGAGQPGVWLNVSAHLHHVWGAARHGAHAHRHAFKPPFTPLAVAVGAVGAAAGALRSPPVV